MIDIFISSFFRPDMTKKTIKYIQERTSPGTYQIHIYDNASDKKTRDYFYGLLEDGSIVSLHLDSRNTGCFYNKAVYHSLVESTEKYYVVTDNDIYPPLIEPDWLSQMISIMDRHPDIAVLTPFLPPILGDGPFDIKSDVIYCPAVGNALKIIRYEAFPKYPQELYKYGDDGMFSSLLNSNGWRSAFCRNIFCWHAGQCTNWGYNQDELIKDPRKSECGQPFMYEPIDQFTYEPPEWLKLKNSNE